LLKVSLISQTIGHTQEAALYFKQAATIHKDCSPIAAIDSLHCALACSLSHRDYSACSENLQSIINLCFVATSPHRIIDSPAAPIHNSFFTNTIISSRISLILLKTLHRDTVTSSGTGGLPHLFIQLAESRQMVYSHDFSPEPSHAVMVLQDFVKACQMRNLEFMKLLLPSLAPTLSPLQWKMCNMILDDVVLDRL
jgi:hypothetical protein